MIRTQVYIPQQLHREAVLLANREKIPFAEAVRQALQVWIGVKRKKRNGSTVLLEIAKRAKEENVRLGKNLSTKIDEILYD